MLIQTATTDLIELVTSAAAAVDVHASWMDHTLSTDNYEAGRTPTAITTAATTTIVSNPAAGNTRNVKTIHIRNKDAAITTDVTVQFDAAGTNYELHKVTLAPGESLEYVEGIGFFHLKPAARLNLMLVTTADVINATTSFADITGLTTPILSGKTYAFQVFLLHIANATTTGHRFGVNGPASPTYLRLGGVATVTGSITTPVFTTAVAAVSAYDTAVHGAVITGPATEVASWFGGTIVPSANGTFAVRCQSEVAVAAGLTVRRGSWLHIREADNA